MNTPTTHLALYRAVREVVGPDAHVSVAAAVSAFRGDEEMEQEWTIYFNVIPRDPCMVSAKSIGSVWQRFLDEFCRDPVYESQFDAAELAESGVVG